MTQRPDAELATVHDAWMHVRRALDTFTDEQARGASLLPGWTRGHVLTHLARSADGDRRCAEHAARGEIGMKYPEGMEARATDIEAGAARAALDLVADLETAQHALVASWSAHTDDAWTMLADTPMGLRTIADLVSSRRRELLVHLVDLDVGVTPRDLPVDYLTADAAWLTASRADW
jgi:maleylpyruvate isomerase